MPLDESTHVGLPLRWIVAGLMAAFALGGTWVLVRLHASDSIVHLDPVAVQAKGGPVYREDLREVKDTLVERIRSESEATRTLIRERSPASSPAPLRLRCRSSGGAMQCESAP